MKHYLIEKGVNGDDIFIEELSFTTLENAYYSRTIHLDPMGIENSYVVSNSFHMPLVKYCFGLVFGDKIKPEFIEASNDGLGPEENEIWSNIIEKMTTKIYPVLFKNVHPGDLEAIVLEKSSEKFEGLGFDKTL